MPIEDPDHLLRFKMIRTPSMYKSLKDLNDKKTYAL